MAVINNFPSPSILSNTSSYNQSMGIIGSCGNTQSIGKNGLEPFDTFGTYTEDLELAADLLAGGCITGPDYFRVKHMIKSKDPDVRALGRTFLHEKSKL